MADILIVDDDRALTTMLSTQVSRGEHCPSVANTLSQGVELAEQSNFDIIFLDVQMPDGNGLDFIPIFRRMPAEPEVIIITGQGDPDGAEKAITSGAWGYIEKPHILTDLNLQMTRALQYRSEKLKSITMQPVALQRQEEVAPII
jgi:two-component system, NtrC family, response regulator